MKKKIIIISLVLVALAAGLYTVKRSGFFAAKYKGMILSRLETLIRGEVSVGKVRGGVFSALVLEEVEVRLPYFPGRVEVEQIGVRLSLWDMLVRRAGAAASVSSIKFKRPRIFCFGRPEEFKDYLAALPDLFAGSEEVVGEEVPPSAGKQAAPVVHPRLQISDGTVLFLAADRSERISFTGIYALLSPAADKTKISFKVEESGSAKGYLEGNGFIGQDGDVDVMIRGKKLSTSQLMLFVPAQKTFKAAAGRVRFSLRLRRQAGSPLAYEGKLQLAGLQLELKQAAVKLTDLHGELRFKDNSLVLSDLRFEYLGVRWWAVGKVEDVVHPDIVFKAVAEDWQLSEVPEILRLVKPFKVKGKGRAVLRAEGPPANLLFKIMVDLPRLSLGMLELEEVHAVAKYSGRYYRLPSLRAKLYGGDLSGYGHLEKATAVTAGDGADKLEFSFELENVDLARGLKLGEEVSFKNYCRVKLSGTLQEPRLELETEGILVPAGGSGEATAYRASSSFSNFRSVLSGAGEMYRLRGNEIGEKTGTMQVSANWIDGGLSIKEMVFKQRGAGKRLGQLSLSGRLHGKEGWDLGLVGKSLRLEELPVFRERLLGYSGVVKLRGAVRGRIDRPEIELSIKSDKLSKEDISLGPWSCRMNWRFRDVLSVKEFSLGRQFSLVGDLSRESGISVDVQATALPLARLLAVLGVSRLRGVQGALSGEIKLRGRAKELAGRGWWGVGKFELGGLKGNKISTWLGVDEGRVILEDFVIEQGTGKLLLEGEWRPLADKRELFVSCKSENFRWWGAEITASGEVDGKSVPGGYEFSGRVSNLELAGEERPDIRLGITNLPGKMFFNVDWGKSAYLAGSVDRKQENRLDGKLILKDMSLRRYFPELSEVVGELSGMGELKGDWGSPRLEGDYFLHQASYVGRELAQFRFSASVIGWPFKEEGLMEGAGGFVYRGARLVFNGHSRLGAPAADELTTVFSESIAAELKTDYKGIGDKERSVALKLALKEGSLQTMLGLLPGSFPREEYDGELKIGAILISGRLGRPRIRGRIHVGAGVLAGYRFRELYGDFEYQDKQLMIGRLIAAADDSSLAIDNGRLIFRGDDIYDLRLPCRGRKLRLLGVPLDGEVELNGIYKRVKGKTEYEGREQVRGLRVGRRELGDFVVDHRYRDGEFDFRTSAEGDVGLVGRLKLLPRGGLRFSDFSLRRGEQVLFFANGDFKPQGKSDLQVRSREEGVALVIAAMPWLAADLTGRGDLNLTYKGTSDNPSLLLSFDLSNGRLNNLKYDAFHGMVRWENKMLDLSPLGPVKLLYNDAKSRLLVSGRIPLAMDREAVLEDEINLDFRLAGGDLSILQVLPTVKRALGPMSLRLTVEGKLDAPRTMGELSVTGGELALDVLIGQMKELDCLVRLEDNVIEIADFSARVGRDRFFISTPPLAESQMVLEDLRLKQLDLRLWTDQKNGVDFFIPRVTEGGSMGQIKLRGQGDSLYFVISGPLASPHCAGVFELLNTRLTWPPEARASGGFDYGFLDHVDWDLVCEAGKNFTYYRKAALHRSYMNVINGENLVVTGSVAQGTIGCKGTVRIDGGMFHFGRSEFPIHEAAMYLPKGSLIPYIQGRAEKIVRDVDPPGGELGGSIDLRVIMDFAGPIGDIKTTPRSEPSLDPDPARNTELLLSYLTFGEWHLRAAGDGLMTKRAAEGIGAGEKLFTDLAEVKVEDTLRKYSPIDEVRIRANPFRNAMEETLEGGGNTGVRSELKSFWGGTELGLGSHIRDDLYLEYRQKYELQMENYKWQRGVGVEYDLSKHIKLKASMDEERDKVNKSIGFDIRSDFGLENIPDPWDKEAPHITEQKVLVNDEGEVVIAFYTNELSRCLIEYYRHGHKDKRSVTAPTELRANHRMPLSGLMPDTTYHYRIQLVDDQKNQGFSEWEKLVAPGR